MDRTSNNGLKYQPERSSIDFRKITQLRLIMKHWNRLSSSLMIYKTELVRKILHGAQGWLLQVFSMAIFQSN